MHVSMGGRSVFESMPVHDCTDTDMGNTATKPEVKRQSLFNNFEKLTLDLCQVGDMWVVTLIEYLIVSGH